MYPTKENVKLEGDAAALLGSYNFGKNVVTHFFCKDCGSSVFFEIKPPPPETVTAAEGSATELPTLVGVNVSFPPLPPRPERVLRTGGKV